MMKRLILYIVCLLLAMPTWAWQETVTVDADETETLPTSVNSRLQRVADALGLTLIGWTPSEITDGKRPTTYYGLGATVTPDVETTYYAMFARADGDGEVIIRQCASPMDGDSVLLATIAGGVCLLAPNTWTNNLQLQEYTSSWSGSLMAHTVVSTNSCVWKYIAQSDSKFNLQSAVNAANYLNVNSNIVKCGTTSSNEFKIQDAYLYNPYAAKYLQCKTDNSGNIYWGVGGLPSSQSFAFYRKERYVDFATSIGQVPGCDNCFIYVP